MAELDWVVRLVSDVRAVRSEMNVPVAAQPTLQVHGASAATRARLATYDEIDPRASRASKPSRSRMAPGQGRGADLARGGASSPCRSPGSSTSAKEKGRLGEELDKAKGEIDKIEKKLGNEQFVAKAPPEVIEEQRERLAEIAPGASPAGNRARPPRGAVGAPPRGSARCIVWLLVMLVLDTSIHRSAGPRSSGSEQGARRHGPSGQARGRQIEITSTRRSR